MMPIKKSLSLERKLTFGAEGEELNAINDAIEKIQRTQMEILRRIQEQARSQSGSKKGGSGNDRGGSSDSGSEDDDDGDDEGGEGVREVDAVMDGSMGIMLRGLSPVSHQD